MQTITPSATASSSYQKTPSSRPASGFEFSSASALRADALTNKAQPPLRQRRLGTVETEVAKIDINSWPGGAFGSALLDELLSFGLWDLGTWSALVFVDKEKLQHSK